MGKSRRTKRMQGTPQAYLSVVVGVRLPASPNVTSWLNAPLMRMPFCREDYVQLVKRVALQAPFEEKTRQSTLVRSGIRMPGLDSFRRSEN